MTVCRRLLLAAAFCLAPAASRAVSVPLPVEGSTLNLTVFIQTQALLNENGSPDGQSPSYDVFVRRSRLQVNGDIGKSFSYYFQVDNTNFGKFGNFTGRLIVQDAWVGWVPTGNTGPTVVYLEGGIVYLPVSRGVLTSSASQPTAEGHPDLYRGFSSSFYSANRTTGVQVRGWALGKRLGFRGGVYEGVQPTAADPGLNPHRVPAVGGFVNFNILGSEEGSFLYQSIYFAKDPILSISLSGSYQSRAIRVPKGVTDQREIASTLFLDYPLSEQQELVFMLAGYGYGNGTAPGTPASASPSTSASAIGSSGRTCLTSISIPRTVPQTAAPLPSSARRSTPPTAATSAAASTPP